MFKSKWKHIIQLWKQFAQSISITKNTPHTAQGCWPSAVLHCTTLVMGTKGEQHDQEGCPLIKQTVTIFGMFSKVRGDLRIMKWFKASNGTSDSGPLVCGMCLNNCIYCPIWGSFIFSWCSYIIDILLLRTMLFYMSWHTTWPTRTIILTVQS